MGQVVKFERPEEDEPTLTGPARCEGCHHEWECVAPVGQVTDLECPACRRFVGIRLGAVFPTDEQIWTCHCGCQAFVITPTRTLCYNCGCLHTDFS